MQGTMFPVSTGLLPITASPPAPRPQIAEKIEAVRPYSQRLLPTCWTQRLHDGRSLPWSCSASPATGLSRQLSLQSASEFLHHCFSGPLRVLFLQIPSALTPWVPSVLAPFFSKSNPCSWSIPITATMIGNSKISFTTSGCSFE